MSLTNSPFWFSSGATSSGGGGNVVYPYSIDQSLRFDAASESELSKTFVSGGNRRKWTFSTWMKRSELTPSGNDDYIFGTNTGAANSTFMFLNWRAGDDLIVTGQSTLWLRSDRVFRDVSGWYHIVWSLDTDNAIASQRMRLYVNGTELTSFSTDSRSSLSGDQAINAAVEHNIGRHPSSTGYGLGAYLAETHFVDGQVLSPSDFGETINGIWVPKTYSGSYGTTGFYLPYEQDASSGSSAFFNRSGSSALTFTNTSHYDIGSSDDFTIEAFINPTTTMMSTYSYLLGNYGGPSGPYMMLQFSPINNEFYFYYGNGGAYQFVYTAGDIVAGQWHHIAINRASGNLRFFLDGVQKGSTQASNTVSWNNNDFKIGMAPLHAFDGYISNVRMVVGSAVYADGATITVPTSTLTNVTNTQLLALTTSTITQDASSNNVTGTLSGSGYFSSVVSPFASSNFFDDASGNNNNFSATNLVTSDVVPDSPTNNFATLNALDVSPSYDATLSDGNLQVTPVNGANWNSRYSTMYVSSGKWYFEYSIVSGTGGTFGGIIKEGATDTNYIGYGANGYGYYSSNGQVQNNASAVVTYNTYTTGDIIGVALNMDDGEVEFFKNGTSQGSAITGLTGSWGFGLSMTVSGTKVHANFGQDSTFAGNTTAGGNADANGYGDFKYAPPSGFLAMCSANLPAPAIGPQLASGQQSDNYFEPILYIGNGATQHIGSGGAQHPIDVTTVANSIRFNDDDSAYLSRTPASAGNRKTFTLSTWIKPNPAATNYPPIFNAGTSAPDTVIRLDNTGKLQVVLENGGGSDSQLTTNRTLKSSSTWYHILVAVDTTNATADDRIKIYIDGVEETSFASRTNPSLNLDTNINNTVVHKIGAQRYASYWDGYMAEMYFIDGTALDPTYFGQYGSNGYWIPKAVSGLTFGTNGFYLDFSDNSTATALGTDSSGNANNFSATNVATTDQMLDSPTQNFVNLGSVLSVDTDGGPTHREGNLQAYDSASACGRTRFQLPKTGKWYFETKVTSGAGIRSGVADESVTVNTTNFMGVTGNVAGNYYVNSNGSGASINGATGVALDGGSSAFSGTILTKPVGVIVNMDDKRISFQCDRGSGLETIGPFSLSHNKLHAGYNLNGDEITFNFGADDSFAGNDTGGTDTADDNGYGSFYYTPPTGYLALVDDNIPVEGITGPDFIWYKRRDGITNHGLFDSVRGINLLLQSNLTTVEQGISGVSSFDYDGFTLGTNTDGNASGGSYVAWTWKAGGKANTFNVDGTGYASMTAAGLTDGSIAATGLSVNTTSGFSIVSYTCGSGVTSGTVAHGLGVQPQLIIGKTRNHAVDWYVETPLLAANLTGILNSTSAWYDPGYNHWNDTYPTDTVFSVGGYMAGHADLTSPSTKICYCFANVDGYQKVGLYTGNNSTDGPFSYTGFRPAFVIIKRTDSAAGWVLYDDKRDTYNQMQYVLWPNLNNAEYTSNLLHIDFLSNGFKVRNATYGETNASGGTYIYIAFAEAPFKYANAR